MRFLKTNYILCFIFLLGFVIRFLYFPGNIYFGFDQARDAFAVKEILNGNLKLIGPSTSMEGLFHGPLYYYIFTPFYLFSSGDPISVALFLRIFNSLGIFLAFAAGLIIFGWEVGIISAFLFAISFEQSQYAIFINHPALADLSVVLIYLGFALLIFKKKNWGLVVGMFGLGLSIAFEMIEIYQIFSVFLLLILFRKKVLAQNLKTYFYSLVALLLPLASFIIAEIKYDFRSLRVVLHFLNNFSSDPPFLNLINHLNLLLTRSIHDNLISNEIFIGPLIIFIGICFTYFLKIKKYRNKLLFILIWFLSGFLPYLKDTSTIPIYFYQAGTSIALLVFVAFLIKKITNSNKIFYLLLLIPLISNIYLITLLNPKGSIESINVQTGMLLKDEKEAVDYIYNQARGKDFTINALTMPLNIDTTWSYLFEWYGQREYHYLPVWGGDAASGYPGNLVVIKSRSDLPPQNFLILEPTRGIQPYLIEDFMKNENYFSKVDSQKQFGKIIVQKRFKF